MELLYPKIESFPYWVNLSSDVLQNSKGSEVVMPGYFARAVYWFASMFFSDIGHNWPFSLQYG